MSLDSKSVKVFPTTVRLWIHDLHQESLYFIKSKRYLVNHNIALIPACQLGGVITVPIKIDYVDGEISSGRTLAKTEFKWVTDKCNCKKQNVLFVIPIGCSLTFVDGNVI